MINRYKLICRAVYGLVFCSILLFPLKAFSLLYPRQVLVIANQNVPAGVSLAKYYMKKRHIPVGNLLLIKTVKTEGCSRSEYNYHIAAPIRAYLKRYGASRDIRCLVLMYGVPLKIGPAKLDRKASQRLNSVNIQISHIKARIRYLRLNHANTNKGYRRDIAILRQKLRYLVNAKRFLTPQATTASVDSELALVENRHYELAGWIANRLFLGIPPYLLKGIPRHVIMVSRLDAPSPKIVKRIINDSLYAEQHGLKGIAYFDARWHNPPPNRIKKIKREFGYNYFDWSIHLAARVVKMSGVMPVVLDQRPQVFQKGQCPDAALYCGWYHLAHYVDAFTWQRGAVGYHIASGECTTLHNGASDIWCVKMLEKGVAATLGPVREPYVEAFPIPELFFTLLLDGRFSLAECYAYSKRFWSWQMVLIGDPLYRPFAYRAILHPLNQNPVWAYRYNELGLPWGLRNFLSKMVPHF